MGNSSIPSLAWDDSYKYLGVDYSKVRNGCLDRLGENVLNIVDKILASMLTPWQKINVINMFALSKLSFKLAAASLNRSWASKLDCRLRKKIKFQSSTNLVAVEYNYLNLKPTTISIPLI